MKYGIRSLKKDFPTDDKCLEFIFNALHSKECSCGGAYKRIKGRKQYQCSKCRFQIAPTAGTIFHKSETPLTLWFHAILAFSNAKSGLSAKQLSRDLEVTYKCAWRMLNLIRSALPKDFDKLSGDVETDAGFFGGKGYGGTNNEKLGDAMARKSVVMVAIERGGNMKAEVVQSTGTYATMDFVEKNVEQGTRLHTDGSNSYARVAKNYNRESVNHKREYVRGDVHVNNVERFFAHVKRSLAGTHKSVSKQYLQTYLDAFVFHYNNRHSDSERFASLLGAVLRNAR